MEDKNKVVTITLADACFIGYIMGICFDFHKEKNFLTVEELIQMKEIEQKFLDSVKIPN